MENKQIIDGYKASIRFMYNMGHRTYKGKLIENVEEFINSLTDEEIIEMKDYPMFPMHELEPEKKYCPYCGMKQA